jgi:uncharacterized protein involved in outer membrane biogenesis
MTVKAWTSNLLSRPGFRKGAAAGIVAVLAYALLGFLALPGILKTRLEKTVSDSLHRNASVREVRVNPFDLSVILRDLSIGERNATGTWISAGEIYANFQVASVFRGGPVVREVRIVRPYVNVVRKPDGSYNFSDLVEEFQKIPKDEAKPLRYSLNNIRIIDGNVDFDDGPKHSRHEVRDIRIAIPFISNLPHHVELFTEPSFSAVVNGKAVSLGGKTRPFHDTRETVFRIDVANLDLPRYLEYLPARREYEVPSAFLDLKGIVSYVAHRDRPPEVRVEGEATLREVRVRGNDNAPMIWLPRFHLAISPSDVIARDFRIAGITVEDPEIDVALDRNGKLNLSALSIDKKREIAGNKNEKEGAAGAAGDKPASRVSVESFRLAGGKVRFSDQSRAEPFRTTLNGIRIEADHLDTEKGKTADVRVSFGTGADESLDIKGKLSLSPVAAEGEFTVANVVLKKYSPYYSGAVRFDVDGGTVDLRAGYRFAPADGDTGVRLSGLSARIANLRLRQREEREEFLKIPEFTLSGAEIDLDKKQVVIGEIATERGAVSIRRGAAGEPNIARLLPEAAPPPTPFGVLRKREAGGGTPEPPWIGTLKKVAVDRYSVRFSDLAADPPVELSLDRIRIRADDISTAKDRKGRISFSAVYDREGSVSLGGAVTVVPPSFAGRLSAKDLPIGRMQPYYSRRVRILLTGGTVSAEGNVSFLARKEEPIRAGFEGEVSVNGFSSLDKAREEDFLKFGTLHLGGLEAGYNPTRVAVREVSLSDFYSRIIVNPDGTLNVQGLVMKEEAAPDNAATEPASPAASPPEGDVPGGGTTADRVPVRIDALTLQEGTVQFSDQYIRPNYSARLEEIGGRVTGLSSEAATLADVELRGRLGAGAPLEIRGKVNPLAEDLFLDLRTEFRDMDLSPLSPYSGRYAGYRIQKGKLSLSLAYHIEKGKLDAKNKVFLDQFTFGEAVDSPDATKLPVHLAVSLLKDRKGEIHLDIPVTGQLDDPKFSVWGIIWQIVKNLLVKAATSPFALLGAIFGGSGEELSYLEFEPGSAAIPEAEAGKTGNLAKVLADRPALKVEIEGHVDLENDREALRQTVFRRKVAARKQEELARAGEAAPPVDNVRIGTAEYPKYLAQAYRKETFPKPRNFLGMAKDLPVPEMEKLMLTNIRVTDDDLRQLAMERASRVRDRLAGPGKVEAERIFLVEPKSLAPERNEKRKDSRVDFRIR